LLTLSKKTPGESAADAEGSSPPWGRAHPEQRGCYRSGRKGEERPRTPVTRRPRRASFSHPIKTTTAAGLYAGSDFARGGEWKGNRIGGERGGYSRRCRTRTVTSSAINPEEHGIREAQHRLQARKRKVSLRKRSRPLSGGGGKQKASSGRLQYLKKALVDRRKGRDVSRSGRRGDKQKLSLDPSGEHGLAMTYPGLNSSANENKRRRVQLFAQKNARPRCPLEGEGGKKPEDRNTRSRKGKGLSIACLGNWTRSCEGHRFNGGEGSAWDQKHFDQQPGCCCLGVGKGLL